MAEKRRKPPQRWNVMPLVELEADVPVPFRVEATNDNQVALTLNVGDTVLIDPATGTITNGYGSVLGRLVREKSSR